MEIILSPLPTQYCHTCWNKFNSFVDSPFLTLFGLRELRELVRLFKWSIQTNKSGPTLNFLSLSDPYFSPLLNVLFKMHNYTYYILKKTIRAYCAGEYEKNKRNILTSLPFFIKKPNNQSWFTNEEYYNMHSKLINI